MNKRGVAWMIVIKPVLIIILIIIVISSVMGLYNRADKTTDRFFTKADELNKKGEFEGTLDVIPDFDAEVHAGDTFDALVYVINELAERPVDQKGDKIAKQFGTLHNVRAVCEDNSCAITNFSLPQHVDIIDANSRYSVVGWTKVYGGPRFIIFYENADLTNIGLLNRQVGRGDLKDEGINAYRSVIMNKQIGSVPAVKSGKISVLEIKQAINEKLVDNGLTESSMNEIERLVRSKVDEDKDYNDIMHMIRLLYPEKVDDEFYLFVQELDFMIKELEKITYPNTQNAIDVFKARLTYFGQYNRAPIVEGVGDDIFARPAKILAFLTDEDGYLRISEDRSEFTHYMVDAARASHVSSTLGSFVSQSGFRGGVRVTSSIMRDIYPALVADVYFSNLERRPLTINGEKETLHLYDSVLGKIVKSEKLSNLDNTNVYFGVFGGGALKFISSPCEYKTVTLKKEQCGNTGGSCLYVSQKDIPNVDETKRANFCTPLASNWPYSFFGQELLHNAILKTK